MPIPRPVLLLLCAALAAATPADARADDALARRLLNSQGCKACHSLDGDGATLGPNLDQVGSRLTAAQLRARLVNPQKQHAGGRVADFSHLKERELAALIDFLSQRR